MRRELLADLAGPLAALVPQQAARMWLDILPILARRRRSEILEDIPFLVARLASMGSRPQLAQSVAEAVIAVGDWWP